jgi:hypothetical protein
MNDDGFMWVLVCIVAIWMIISILFMGDFSHVWN